MSSIRRWYSDEHEQERKDFEHLDRTRFKQTPFILTAEDYATLEKDQEVEEAVCLTDTEEANFPDSRH